MNLRGPDWCEENMDAIICWLRAEAKKRHLPFVDTAGRVIVRRAISNARRKEKTPNPKAESTRRAIPMKKWAYGVTTVPSRFGHTLDATLQSLAEAGFDKPRLFIDGALQQSQVDALEIPYTIRQPAAKAFQNWFLSLWELYMRNPEADLYAIFQDDIEAVVGLREYLESQPFPSDGYWNLYTNTRNERLNQKKQRGWFHSNQRGLGALGLVFDHQTVVVLLEDKKLRERVKNKLRGSTAIDGAVITAMKWVGRKECVHFPSLLQHRETKSVMGHRGARRVSRSFDHNALEVRE
ncbi:MAG TPA: hypothetical protein VMY18_09470 [Acidobacteriota bacterium]|nr:hypothetical protein [Acidobacteriota bacterium]